MDAQQLHDYIIKPTLEYMDSLGGNYNTKEARFLNLGTSAVECNCGYKIAQDGIKLIDGALGMFQMEKLTHDDIWSNCDALRDEGFAELIMSLSTTAWGAGWGRGSYKNLLTSPMYACAMARLKYSMDKEALSQLPDNGVKGLIASDAYSFWVQYKRIYNTELGDATFERWTQALNDNRIFDVDLGD